MSLKRKRSLPSLTLHLPSPPTASPSSNRSDSTRWSTSPQTSPSPPPATSTRSALYPSRHLWDVSNTEDRHLDSRTRKRTRDNRPAQEVVYQTTLGRLFGAQQQRQPPPPPASFQQSVDHQVLQQQQTDYNKQRGNARQKSLHSFWTLPSTLGSTTTAVMAVDSPVITTELSSPSSLLRCEDCDRLVVEAGKVGAVVGDGMDIDGGADGMMDGLSSGSETEMQCEFCGRVVCGLCAVQGDRRVCLGCARNSGGGEIWGR